MTSDTASAGATSQVDAAVQAREEYTAELVANPDLARLTAETLVNEQVRRGVTVNGKPLCHVIRPRFLSTETITSLAEASGQLARIFERAGKLLLASDALLEEIGASEAERKIWQTDPGYPGFTLTSRLDSFITNGEPSFIEYNAESPAGIAFSDALWEIFRDLPATAEWAGVPEQALDGRGHLLDVLQWAYGTWGGRDRPAIAIIDWQDVITRRDFELCADYFRARGLETVICDPRRLEYHQGKVWYESQKITVVYRRVLLHELLEKAFDARPLLRAYADGAICMVNSPRSKLLHKKAVLALLSEEALFLDLSEEEKSLIRRTVPWTRRVRDGQTEYRGEVVDLLKLLARGQERFAIKPADDYGGRGVVLGWNVSEEEWDRTLERALTGDYIVQERVGVPVEEFPVWNNDGVGIAHMMLDTDPLLFRDRLGGVLTRVSSDPLLNVTAGTGSTTATFVVGGEA